MRRVIGPLSRPTAHRQIDEAPDGNTWEICAPVKKRIQENLYHKQIEDIAKQTTYIGRKWDDESMKRILIDEFALEMRNAGTPIKHDGGMIPSEDGKRVIWLGVPSSRFLVPEASAFIEFLTAWGIDRGVVWSEHKEIK